MGPCKHQLKMSTKENIEYTTLVELTADITSEIAADPLAISEKLRAKGFIAEAQHNAARSDSITDQEKASKLLEQVTRKVKLRRERFHEFVKILSEFMWLKDIVESIQEKLEHKISQQDTEHLSPNNSDEGSDSSDKEYKKKVIQKRRKKKSLSSELDFNSLPVRRNHSERKKSPSAATVRRNKSEKLPIQAADRVRAKHRRKKRYSILLRDHSRRVLGGDSDEGMPSSDSESSPNEMLYQKRRLISAYAYVAPHFNQQYYSRENEDRQKFQKLQNYFTENLEWKLFEQRQQYHELIQVFQQQLVRHHQKLISISLLKYWSY